ncbi:hypothetical protein IL306_000656 [Fusarium sp. DS 682]|nr:hypothetical protein IL306_000656 [Fusarium sp. DS 682]
MPKLSDSRRGDARKGPYDKTDAGKSIFKYNTNIGQHILKNPGIADMIVAKASLKPTDTVLEIGPGTGVLTTRILEQAKAVKAVELDLRMGAELTKRVQGKPEQQKLEIIMGDFAKLDLLEALPPIDVCISNTPYQISSIIISKLISLPQPPRVSVLMVQREFGLRLCARPGDSLYSRLSVNTQFTSKVALIAKVGKNNFSPPPEVESVVVRLEPRPETPAANLQELDGMLRICFSRKNKILRASFIDSEELCGRNWITWAAMYPDKVSQQDLQVLRDSNDTIDAHQSVCGIPVSKATLKSFIRGKIEHVLDKTELAEARSVKCDENDFLRLLLAFRENNIYFT